MKLLFDIFPVLLFAAAYWLWDIYVATAVTIAATSAQVGWSWLRHRKVDAMLWMSFSIIVVFGGATLWLHDEAFIKWKPTVLYWLFSLILLGADLLFRKNLIRAMMEKQLTLPDPVWRKLNWSWIVFFGVLGGVNLYIAFHFPTAVWVKFKVGIFGLILIFIVVQALLLSRHIEQEEKK